MSAPQARPAGEVAREYWGTDMPDWVARLVEECAFSSQNQVAQRLGLTGPVISQVLRRKYNNGNMSNVENQVRGVLMAEVVNCPSLGRVPKHECRSWRKKARQFVGSNVLRVQMYRACNRCPLNQKGKPDAGN